MAAGWISSKPAAFSQEERMTPEEQDRNQHFWTLLLLGAILFLIAESLLSNLRFTIDDSRLETHAAGSPQSSIFNRKS
jgi:hypothetical protein